MAKLLCLEQGIMMQFKTRSTVLLAGGVAFIVSMGVAAPAQALVSSGTAYIIESSGVYTLVNNTASYAYQFFVTNSAALQGAEPNTTETGWSSYNCRGSCLGNVPGFSYYDNSTAFDIAPGQSSSRFFFSAPPESTYTIYLRDKAGNNGTTVTGTAVPGAVPEPATWALMMAGLGAAGTALRRRRSSAMSNVTA